MLDICLHFKRAVHDDIENARGGDGVYLQESHPQTADLHTAAVPGRTEGQELRLNIVEAELVGRHPHSELGDAGL